MATGLATFDAFSWASLLARRRMLVVDREAPRARRTGAALEEAGATVTVALSQAIGAQRVRGETFETILLALTGDEAVSSRLADGLLQSPALILLADVPRHAELRQRFPGARIGDHSMSDRDLVLFAIGTADE